MTVAQQLTKEQTDAMAKHLTRHAGKLPDWIPDDAKIRAKFGTQGASFTAYTTAGQARKNRYPVFEWNFALQQGDYVINPVLLQN